MAPQLITLISREPCLFVFTAQKTLLLILVTLYQTSMKVWLFEASRPIASVRYRLTFHYHRSLQLPHFSISRVSTVYNRLSGHNCYRRLLVRIWLKAAATQFRIDCAAFAINDSLLFLPQTLQHRRNPKPSRYYLWRRSRHSVPLKRPRSQRIIGSG